MSTQDALPARTPLQRLADIALEQPVEDWIAALGAGEIDDGTFLADPPTITSATAGLAEGNPTLLAARVEFSVTYRHARGDPYTPA